MSKPKYLWVKSGIQERILGKEYPVGSKIPSESELTKIFKVSRQTVRQAVMELVNEGFLLKRQGSGTYVSSDFINTTTPPSKTIGVITTYMSDYIFPSIIRGMEEELSKHNYSLMLSSTQNDVENEKKSLEKMLKQNVSGLIVEPTKSNLLNSNLNYYLQLTQNNIPMLMLHAKYDELDIPLIAMDDENSGKIATEHLISLGHKKISMITKTDDLQGKKRLKGFIDALTANNLNFESEHLITFNTESKEYLPEKIQKVLCGTSVPTAFVCYNDQIAIMLLQEIQSMGKNVPDHFSVVSHDDSFLSTAFPSLSLTSIVHPKEEMGREAAKWIMNAIEKQPFDKKSIIFHPQLKRGNSTRNLRFRD